ncbi:MAG TPA: hypothetical protein VMZ31_07110 [Phycisphaerae bacterium]|nr:hypothetical protein [Phycisphaerae bacterium]
MPDAGGVLLFDPGGIVWQSTLLLSLGIAASVIWRRWPARAHSALLVAMIACLVTPVASQVGRRCGLGLLDGDRPHFLSANPFEAIGQRIAGSLPSPSIESDARATAVAAGAGKVRSASSPANSADDAAVTPDARSVLGQVDWPAVALWGWVGLTLVLAARIVVSLVSGASLLQRAHPLEDVQLQCALQAAAAKLRTRSLPRLCTSDLVLESAANPGAAHQLATNAR